MYFLLKKVKVNDNTVLPNACYADTICALCRYENRQHLSHKKTFFFAVDAVNTGRQCALCRSEQTGVRLEP